MNLRPRVHHFRWVATVAFTGGLLGLISLAIGGASPNIALTALISVAGLATALHFLLPGSGFFSAVFANSVGIYACLYLFFITVVFNKATPLAVQAGFVLPLAGFLVGVIWRRRQIVAAIHGKHDNIERELLNSIFWLVPLIAVAIMSFAAPLADLSSDEHDEALVGAMLIIALSVLLAGRSIAVFLLDTGLLFEDFFDNIARLVKPAFAFFTWYSLLTIVFGCVYTIIDRFSAHPNFVVTGVARKISFAEGLYLSVVTLSTVGYGDVVAISPAVRLVISLEILTGVMLILFGVQALLVTTLKR